MNDLKKICAFGFEEKFQGESIFYYSEERTLLIRF